MNNPICPKCPSQGAAGVGGGDERLDGVAGVQVNHKDRCSPRQVPGDGGGGVMDWPEALALVAFWLFMLFAARTR